MDLSEKWEAPPKFHGCKKSLSHVLFDGHNLGVSLFFGQTKTYQIVDRPPIMGEFFCNHNPKRCQNTLETWNIYENMRYIMLSSHYDPGCSCFHDLPFWGSVTMGKPMAPATSGRCARPAPSPQAMTQQQVTQGMKSFRSTMPR